MKIVFLEHQLAPQATGPLARLAARKRSRTSFACRKQNALMNNSRLRRCARPVIIPQFHGQKSYNGVAILGESRAARSAACDCAMKRRIRQARVIAATIGDVRVYSDLCAKRTGGRLARLRLQDEMVCAPARIVCEEVKASRASLAVCGDFNVAPNDEDVYDPVLWRGAIMCSDGERAAFRAAVSEAGLTDTLRFTSSRSRDFSAGGITGCSRFPKNRGLRIDAILAGSELAAKCSDAGIDREMRKGKEPSDHAPVWAEFEK